MATGASTPSEDGHVSPWPSDSGLGSIDIGSKSKQWLNFRLLGKSRREDSRGLSPLRPIGEAWKCGEDARGEMQIERADRVFTVAAKDRSMLERIAHKAKDRALRIRKPHEVGG